MAIGNQIIKQNIASVFNTYKTLCDHLSTSHSVALTAGGWGSQQADRPFLKSAVHVVPADTLPACRIVFCQPFVIVGSLGETQMSPDSLFVSALIKKSADYCTWHDVVTFSHLVVRSYQSNVSRQRHVKDSYNVSRLNYLIALYN